MLSSSSGRCFPKIFIRFRADAIADRWRTEINDPQIGTYVAVDAHERLVGFAATAGSELLHFGTAIDAAWVRVARR